jgi:large repetitive protein
VVRAPLGSLRAGPRSAGSRAVTALLMVVLNAPLLAVPVAASPADSPDPAATPQAQKAATELPWDRGPKVEQPAKRTTTSRTFQNGDGTYTTDYFSAPVFYRDSSGAMVPIEAVPVASSKDGVAFETKAGPVAVELADSSVGDTLTVRSDGHSITFRPTLERLAIGAASPADRSPVVDAGQVVFADVFPGVDLRYTILPNGAKEDIVVNEPGAGSRFAFVLDAPG